MKFLIPALYTLIILSISTPAKALNYPDTADCGKVLLYATASIFALAAQSSGIAAAVFSQLVSNTLRSSETAKNKSEELQGNLRNTAVLYGTSSAVGILSWIVNFCIKIYGEEENYHRVLFSLVTSALSASISIAGLITGAINYVQLKETRIDDDSQVDAMLGTGIGHTASSLLITILTGFQLRT